MGQHLDKAARGAYDAIVYIDGSEVVAEDADGRKIASGVAGTDDATVIQSALTGYDHVKLLSGEFRLSSNLYLKTNNILQGSGPSNTIFESNTSDLRYILLFDISHVSLEDFGMGYFFAILCTADTQSLSYVTINNIVGKCRIGQAFGFRARSYPSTDGTVSISNLNLINCVAIDGASGYYFNSLLYEGAINYSYFRDVTIQNCKAINCGREYRRNTYDPGFDVENAYMENVRFIGCHAEGCLESGFHEETSATKIGLVYIGCTSKDNGQKTKESKTIVDNVDLTQSTPFICPYTQKTLSTTEGFGKTCYENKKLHVRLISIGDTISEFSITFVGTDYLDAPISETVTQATSGVIHEIDGWSFYTSAIFKSHTLVTSITVNSVVGASTGDYIAVGQDAQYGAAFVAVKSTHIGCISIDNPRGFQMGGNAKLVSCADYDSDDPIYPVSGTTGNKCYNFSEVVAGVEYPQVNHGAATIIRGSSSVTAIHHGMPVAPTISNGYVFRLAHASRETHSAVVENIDATHFDIVLDTGRTVTSARAIYWTVEKLGVN